MSTPKKPVASPKAASKKSAPKTETKKAKASEGEPAPKAARAKPAGAKARPRKTKGAKAAPVSWKRWLLTEVAVLGAGVSAGLVIAGGFLWQRAVADVDAYLAAPQRPVPGVIWSAPMSLREGQRVSMATLAGDLLAAGYERSDKAGPRDGAVGTFSVNADGFSVWTAPFPGGPRAGGSHALTIRDGLLTEVEPGSRALLHPTVLATVGDLDAQRVDVKLADLSRWVEPALLTMEDARFRQHHGVDPIGLLRAILRNSVAGQEVQGGSTLTQQLAKNLFLSSERRLQRKVREAFFAAALESKLSKDELLELYLSEVYLGQMGGLPLHGVEAAARSWFGKSASRLELHEAAAIIGVIPAPNSYSPVRHPEKAQSRRDLVLSKLHERGAIDDDELAAAKAQPLALRGLEPSRVRRAPYAVDVAVEQAEVALGQGALATGGYQVYTHIQPALQRAAEEAVAAGMAALEAENPELANAQVALVAVDVRDGGVVAMVGGRSYATSPFNRAIDAHRQAGSTVKPLTLLAGVELDLFTPATVFDDQPLTRTFDGTRWTPRNYDGRFVGEITARRAIETSRNIPAVLMAEKVGATRLQRFYTEAGLPDATQLPSAALGGFLVTPLELAGSYTVFADGRAARPRVLDRVTGGDGGEVLAFPADRSVLASPRSAAVALSVLEGVLTHGTGAGAARYGVKGAAGKTGTTDNGRDAWLVGLTPEIAVAVWVGLDQGDLGRTGGEVAMPVWARFIAASGTGGTFDRPEGMVSVTLCPESGQVASAECPTTTSDWFPANQVPTTACALHGAPEERPGLLGRLFGRRRDEDPTPD